MHCMQAMWPDNNTSSQRATGSQQRWWKEA